MEQIMAFQSGPRGATDHPHLLATAILDLFYEAHKLVGRGAILTDGTAGIQCGSTMTMDFEYQFAAIPDLTPSRR
jgi:hypothetical protein